jgi:aminocarboxymuconate-semialdehyde decarboxylase
MYYDTMVFSEEGLDHLVADVGADRLMLGTDYLYPWTPTSVEHVLDSPHLSDAQKTAILGGTAATLASAFAPCDSVQCRSATEDRRFHRS